MLAAMEREPPVVDFVIPHCREAMEWMWDDARFPPRSRLARWDSLGQAGTVQVRKGGSFSRRIRVDQGLSIQRWEV